MTDTWKEWLANPELTGTTRRETIEQAVSRVSASPIEGCERLFRGEQNEVYAIRTRADDELIARISRRPQSPFLGERWTINALRSAGVPTPEVLLVEALDDGSGGSICIQRRLPGTPLAELTLPPTSLTASDRHTYARASGALLRRIHSCQRGAMDSSTKPDAAETQTGLSSFGCPLTTQTASDLLRWAEV